MKFINLLKRTNSKNRPHSIVCFSKDLHLINQLSKEIPLVFISEDKAFFNKTRFTAITTNENPYVKTANLDIDTIILDDHLNNNTIEFIKNILKENPKVSIVSQRVNKKLENSIKLKSRKREYIEYFS